MTTTHRRLISIAAVIAVLVVSFGAAGFASAQAPTATVNTGALNIRSGPGVGYGVVFSVYRGTVMTLLARNSDASWVKVALTNGVQGWVNSRYILTAYPLYSLPLEGGTVTPTATVNTGALNIRSGPGVGYGVVTSVYRGTVLNLLARNSVTTWIKISLANGTQGWVSAPFIASTTPLTSLPVEGGYTPPPYTPPSSPTYRTHVVQPGENLFRISLNYGVNMWEVARLNGIYNLRLIYAGQVLLIP